VSGDVCILIIQIYLEAETPSQLATNAFLKLCKLDVSQETEKWARTRMSLELDMRLTYVAPKFSADGRVAVITINTGFQGEAAARVQLKAVHPVIATRWAGTLGRKSPKLLMVMVRSTGSSQLTDSAPILASIPTQTRCLSRAESPLLYALYRMIKGVS
jgi:hypothetical protein